MAIYQKITLYSDRFAGAQVISAVQNDTDRILVAFLGDFTIQEGMTGKLAFVRSDKTHYEVDAILSPANNTATAELDQALTQAGTTQAQLKITDAGNKGSSFTFLIRVQADVSGASEEQEGWTISELAERIEEKQNKLIEGAGVTLTDNQDGTTTIAANGGSGETFTFTQSVPAEEWKIPHNLHKFPSVTVVDSGGSVVVGEILYIDEDNITVTFKAAFSGKAYLN